MWWEENWGRWCVDLSRSRDIFWNLSGCDVVVVVCFRDRREEEVYFVFGNMFGGLRGFYCGVEDGGGFYSVFIYFVFAYCRILVF